MYKLYTDVSKTFECDIKIQGSSLSKSKARLVVETQDYSLMFDGKIDGSGKCTIPIKKLKGLIDESVKGNIRLEVIAEDTFFIPWESTFDVEATKKVTVEVKDDTSKTPIRESVTVSNVIDDISKEQKNHIMNIMKLLVRENITIENISVKRGKLNSIIATYNKHKPINEEMLPSVIDGVISNLVKKSK